MSACLSSKNKCNLPGTELEGAVLNLRQKIQIRCLLFTFSVKLENWSFHVVDLPKTRKKCTKTKNARAERAKLLFLLIKYAKFVTFSLPSRRRS